MGFGYVKRDFVKIRYKELWRGGRDGLMDKALFIQVSVLEFKSLNPCKF